MISVFTLWRKANLFRQVCTQTLIIFVQFYLYFLLRKILRATLKYFMTFVVIVNQSPHCLKYVSIHSKFQRNLKKNVSGILCYEAVEGNISQKRLGNFQKWISFDIIINDSNDASA
jgi:hypothetical protein